LGWRSSQIYCSYKCASCARKEDKEIGKKIIESNKNRKGIKYSFKRNKKISASMKGIIRSLEHCRNLSISKFKSYNPNCDLHSSMLTYKNGYPLGWTRTFREQIRHRDKYTCQLCGAPEAECIKRLHVHHIDYNKRNIDPDNLVSLCIKCHTKTLSRRDYWINLFENRRNQNVSNTRG
jgi:hypothetical protein